MKKNSKRYKQLISSKEKNAKFEKASAAMKRVMIAKDVIEQINSNNIIAVEGNYFDGGSYPEIGETKLSKVSLQDVLPKMDTCRVCALGGMFYSSIAINNNFKTKVIDNICGEVEGDFEGDDVRKKLRKFFSKYQMGLIESAFESSDYLSENGFYNILSGKKELEVKRAINFCMNTNSKGSMKKIMNNIIENEGKFKP